ncbi:hypothetical protein ACOTHT_30895 [Achromobacter xylosoxidans]
MTNSYDVDHGLSQCPPGPLEPVELAQQSGAAPATGNTARDQEMYAAGIRTGEENAKHNAAIRSGWLPIESAPKDGTEFQAWLNGDFWEPRCRFNPASEAFEIWGRVDYDRDDWDICGHLTATHWMPLPAAPAAPASPVSTVEDAGAQKEAVMEAIADALGSAYDCMRVWSAWSYGTMGPEDFSLVAEDGDRLGEIADAAIAAMRPAPAAGDALAWQGLTDAERDGYVGELVDYGTDFVAPLYSVVESIEKRLREKNAALAAQVPQQGEA